MQGVGLGPAAHDIQKLLGMLENNSPGTAINILMRDVANMGNSKAPKSHLKVIGHGLKDARDAEGGGGDSM